MVMVNKEGIEHKYGWCYPMHKTQRMVHERQIHFHAENLKEEKNKLRNTLYLI